MESPQPDSTETKKLLDRVRQGDAEARAALLSLHRTTLKRFVALRMDQVMRARVDASDIVQETMLEAHERLEEFLRKSPMPFHVWLRRTAYERLLNARRHHVERSKRSVRRELPLPESSSADLARKLLTSSTSPSGKVSRHELAMQVRGAFAEMDEPDQEVLLLRIFEGHSHNEVAWILGISEEAARQRQGRALIRLHRILCRHGIAKE